jgi:hypothetical protein
LHGNRFQILNSRSEALMEIASRIESETSLALKAAYIVIIVVIVASVASGLGYYEYNQSLQPSIQVTNLQIGTATTNPQTNTLQDQGRVSESGSFTIPASSSNAVYTLIFDNSFSTFSTKDISLSYTAAGAPSSNQLTVPPGQVSNVQITLNSGQTATGTFSVSGGSGNDIDFSITQYTCTQTVPFSFVLINSGGANGYVVVNLHLEDSTQVYSNRYYVEKGQQLSENGTVNIADCSSHSITDSVSQQEKA